LVKNSAVTAGKFPGNERFNQYKKQVENNLNNKQQLTFQYNVSLITFPAFQYYRKGVDTKDKI